MLSERERRELAGIEQQLHRDRWFAVRMRRRQVMRARRWRILGLGLVAVLGWWVFTPLLALWWDLDDALVLALLFTAMMGIAGLTYSRR